jgi:hypothetical protein
MTDGTTDPIMDLLDQVAPTNWEHEAIKAREELEAFKRRVAMVASREGRRHGLCGQLDVGLAELGLERIDLTADNTYRVTLDVAFTRMSQDEEFKIHEIWDHVRGIANELGDREPLGYLTRNYGVTEISGSVTITSTPRSGGESTTREIQGAVFDIPPTDF